MQTTQLESLLSKIDQLQIIMKEIAVGNAEVEDEQDNYSALYQDVDLQIELLQDDGISITNPNKFSSLKAWRNHVRSVGRHTEQRIEVYEMYSETLAAIEGSLSRQYILSDSSSEKLSNELTPHSLESFRISVREIQGLMKQVARGTDIETKEQEYLNRYRQIALQIGIFQELELLISNPNDFRTLWQFYRFWDSELEPGYDSRERFIDSLYEKIVRPIEKALHRHRTIPRGVEDFAQDLKQKFNQKQVSQSPTTISAPETDLTPTEIAPPVEIKVFASDASPDQTISDSELRMPMSTEIFFSYCHRDEDLMKELVKHLSILKRQGIVRDWHDRQIIAGSEWEGQIDEHLNSAQVILLLVSSDFLASDYCWGVETQKAMQRHEAGEACVIPVILRPVDWQGAPFGMLQSLPKDTRPITSWTNRDEAFLDVAQGIRKAIEQMKLSQPKPMSDRSSNNIQEVIQRVILGNSSQADLRSLADAVKAGQVTLATGDRSVAIGGNAANAIVIAGDNTVIVQGQAAKDLQDLLKFPSQAQPSALSHLTGSQKRRLEQRRDTVQSELDLRNEKLGRLKMALAIEAAESVKFQLEKQIQAEEAKLAEISDELDTIEQSLS